MPKSEFKRWLDEEFMTLEHLNNVVVEIGVIEESSLRNVDDKTHKTKKTEKNSTGTQLTSSGLTNANLLYLHENGSSRFPPRPVLDLTLHSDYVDKLIKDTLDLCAKNIVDNDWSESDVDKELGRMCIRIQSYCRDIIYKNDGRLAPNAPSTAKRKKGNHPLFDTGDLARSIICRFYRKT